jgi:hypothetical protein
MFRSVRIVASDEVRRLPDASACWMIAFSCGVRDAPPRSCRRVER